MKYYLLSFIPLILTLPILGERVIFGIPLWAISSLFFTLVYSIMLIIIIDKKWDDLS